MFDPAMTSFNGLFINLRLVEEGDAGFIINIRSVPTKAGFLSVIESSVDDQKNWIREYKKRENIGAEYYYIIETKDNHPCGTVRLYDFFGQSCSFGSLILGDNKPPKAALESTMATFSLAFNILKISHCEIKTAKSNAHAISFFKRLGVQQYGEDQNEIFLVYRRETFIKNIQNYKRSIGNAVITS